MQAQAAVPSQTREERKFRKKSPAPGERESKVISRPTAKCNYISLLLRPHPRHLVEKPEINHPENIC